MKKNSKKAQTEIFGLAIIVVMLAFGLILILAFAGKSPPSELKTLNEELSDKFVSAYLETTTTCKKLSIQELITDVVDYSPSGSITCENGESSYQFLDSTTDFILNNSVSVWKSDRYEFEIYLNENTPLMRKGILSCTSKTGKEYPLPSTRGGTPIYVRLRVCY